MIYATTPEEIEPRRKAFIRKWRLEPPRDCRRLFGLSYAAMAACSSMA